MNKRKKQYKQPKIEIKKIKLEYFFSGKSSFFGDEEIMQVLLAKKSDSQLKKNIQPYEVANILEKLEQMKVVSFNWNTKSKKYNLNPKEPYVGFIAQQVESIFPELVSKDRYSIKEIDYGKFLSLVVLSVQKLHSENKELKKRLDKIELLLNKQLN